MVSVTKYAGSVSQTTGGHFVSFDNLANIKVGGSGNWAVSSTLIQGKSESKNRPSTISGSSFGFQLPVGAEPVRVKVKYRHSKAAGSDYSSKYPKRICNIPAPTISLLGVSGFMRKGVAPTTSWVTSTATFELNGKVTRAQINSNSFGFKIDYPTNANSWNGYMRISFVDIEVEYRTTSYSVGVKKRVGGYNGDDYTVTASISNVNLTSYNPSVTITSPLGFSFKSFSGDGTLTKVNERTFLWKPELGRRVSGVTYIRGGTSSIDLVFETNVSFPSGSDEYTGTFTIGESLTGASNSFVATITKKPPKEDEETGGETHPVITPDDDLPIPTEWHKVNIGEKIKPELEVNDNGMIIFGFPVSSNGNVILEDEDTPINNGYEEFEQDSITTYDSSKELHQGIHVSKSYFEGDYWFKCDTIGLFVILMYNPKQLGTPYWEDYWTPNWTFIEGYSEDTPVIAYFFEVVPIEEDLTVPFLTTLQLTEEELYRLGTGFTYTIQSFIKHITDDTFVRDWYKNNRIGVFNNPITDNITVEEVYDQESGEIIDEIITDTTDYDNLSPTDLFTYADYWSKDTGGLNEYESVECQFTYNSDYPLYILMTGDYNEATTYGFDVGSIEHTTPCIIENYKEYTSTGIYPISIIDLIGNDDRAELSLEYGTQTEPIILYDLPLDEHYGTNDTTAIRGITVNADIEYSDEQVVYAKLKSPTGATGQRSVVIGDKDIGEDTYELEIGGIGDLWGFNTLDLIDLEDWELEITASNILGMDVANLNIGNFTITFHMETVDKQDIECKIDGENIAFYGAFIQSVNIPEGLETDTSFLTIDGTDTNDAYRQNIREKTIELEIDIGDCDLKSNTDSLRQFTKLIQNEKDQYNRPIPKHITFSHYPDVYWEYIMKESMDITNEVGVYNVKAKLVIPSGTAYDKETTVTNTTGYVQGLAAINPIITIAPNSDTIEIEETISGQKFHIGYAGEWNDKIVQINCEDRQVLLMTDEDDTDPTDISRFVDLNSDWFHLHGEFNFDTNNCTLRTVEYTERW